MRVLEVGLNKKIDAPKFGGSLEPTVSSTAGHCLL